MADIKPVQSGFSFYRGGIQQVKPTTTITLSEFLQLIRSKKYSLQIAKIRAERDDDKRQRLKAQMDYVTPAGIFSTRKKTGLLSQSGYAVIDIDGLSLSNLQALRSRLVKDQYVAALFISPSGMGFKLFIHVPFDAEKFSNHVMAFYNYLASIYDLDFSKLDAATHDICRACYVSYDPTTYYNPAAEIFDKLQTVVSDAVPKKKIHDETRSADECREICRLLRQGKKKDEIFQKMEKTFVKWSTDTQNYRERTFDTAQRFVSNSKQLQEEPVSTELLKKAEENFKDPKLLLLIHSELSKTHLHDDPEKMLAFSTCCSAYLESPANHKSVAFKGGRSEGKDNLIHTCFLHFPINDTLFLTSATNATMQDSLQDKKIIACSEINLKNDDRGANATLLETVKQLTEGGTSAMKKKAVGRSWETEVINQGQKTVLYGSTELLSDDELDTRFIICAISAGKEKIRAVNDDTLLIWSGKKLPEPESWIRAGIQSLLKYNKVIFPWLGDLPSGFFDCTDPRSMRDTKRFLALAAAIAWLHQLQRDLDSDNKIVGAPFDFLAAMIISADFFNHTYAGLGDQRLQRAITAVNSICDRKNSEIYTRQELQEEMKVSWGTVKSSQKGINNLQIAIISHKEGNQVYYKRRQKGIKKELITVKWRQLYESLFINKQSKYPGDWGKQLEDLDAVLKINCDLQGVLPPVSKDFDSFPKIFLPCCVCGSKSEANLMNPQGKPICEGCLKASQVQEEKVK